MAQKRAESRGKKSGRDRKRQDVKHQNANPGIVRTILGAAFLLVAGIAAVLLAIEHITGLALPGCGAESACQQVAESWAGKIPLGSYEWPTAFIGLTYFFAVLVAWLWLGGRLTRGQRLITWFGGLISAVLLGVLITEGKPCPYCIATHVANFAFLGTLLTTRRRVSGGAAGWISGLVAFVVISGALGVWDGMARAERQRRAEAEFGESMERIIERSQRTPEVVEDNPPAATTTAPANGTPEPNQPASTTAPTTAPAAATDRVPFEGRYRWGPERAKIRLVLFTSYQCPDCRRIEADIDKLRRTNSDVAVSIKHFPFNTDCNPCVSQTTQPNACWAARAAEAAGMLYGTEGFWKMHEWLFARHGVFQTTEELNDALRSWGYDPTGFIETMTGEETLRRVRADCEEAEKLGLFFTPMIFVNGEELKGWYLPNAIPQAVRILTNLGVEPGTAYDDHPPLAEEKYVADWRITRPIKLPPDAVPHTRGPADAALRVVVWGDYQEAGTAELDAQVRALLAGADNASYTYRHYPFNSDCNPNISTQRHAYACIAAQAAEAAALVGGEDAFWKMHVWLMEHHDTELTDDVLRSAATDVGLDPDALLTAMKDPQVAAALRDDIDRGKHNLPQLRIGRPAGLFGVPTIFVNERLVPRWKLNGDNVLRQIMHEALFNPPPE